MQEQIVFIGFVIDTLGKLLVSYTTIMVHHRFQLEHQIDEKVFQEMSREKKFGVIGLAMILGGSILEALEKWPFS